MCLSQARTSGSFTLYPDIDTISTKPHTLLWAQFKDQDIVLEKYEVIWKSFPVFFMANHTQMLTVCITTMMQRNKSADTAWSERKNKKDHNFY